MKEEDLQDRVTSAVALFKEGYNCSQAVVAAFADLYGFTPQQALKMAASFGGGIGRMRETCGAACGLFMLAGFETGAIDSDDRDGKASNYALVQSLAKEFVKCNGSINCGELLGLKPKTEVTNIPDKRDDKYYNKRPCVKMVESAAEIWIRYLQNKSLTI